MGRDYKPVEHKKDRGGRPLKGIAELIEESGVDPTQWEFERLAEEIKIVMEWKSYTDKGILPPDFDSQMNSDEAQALVSRHIMDIRERAKTWRDYRIPKQSATQSDITIDSKGPVTFKVEK